MVHTVSIYLELEIHFGFILIDKVHIVMLQFKLGFVINFIYKPYQSCLSVARLDELGLTQKNLGFLNLINQPGGLWIAANC